MSRLRRPSAAVALLAVTACANGPTASPVTWGQLSGLAAPPPDAVVPYGAEPLQFGELRLPDGPGPHPVAVFLHGGCWLSQYAVDHVAPAAEALRIAGVAVWAPEYRRIGDAGGGWPGTFLDAAAATDHLRALAEDHPLDLDRVVLVGHSAGGHLALWLAARDALPASSPIASDDPLPVRGVVGLAAIADLRAYAAGSGSCNAAVPQLVGGAPDAVPERYDQASPAELLPLGVPVRLVHGSEDAIVPPAQSDDFAAEARAAGDDARVVRVGGAGHFDLIAPFAPAWVEVEDAVLELVGTP